MRRDVVAGTPPWHGLSPHIRGHLLLFDRPPAPSYTSRLGMRLLFTAPLAEGARIAYSHWLATAIPLWLTAPLLLALALTAVRLGARVELSQIGLRPWHEWSTTERSYLLQVIVIAHVVFPLALITPLTNRVTATSAAWTLGSVFAPYLFFGFYQEIVYRGVIQGELSRRWGAPAGILVANVLYAFGPLHSAYFAAPAAVAIPMLAAIFAIGLFFGIVYQRSGNLWIVATMHAIGNAYMVTALGALP